MTTELDTWYEKATASLTTTGKEPEWHHYLMEGDSTYQMSFRQGSGEAEAAAYLGKTYLDKALRTMKVSLDDDTIKEVLRLHSRGLKCWFCRK